MSNQNYPYIQYETYEMEPYNNIIPNLNYLKENFLKGNFYYGKY